MNLIHQFSTYQMMKSMGGDAGLGGPSGEDSINVPEGDDDDDDGPPPLEEA